MPVSVSTEASADDTRSRVRIATPAGPDTTYDGVTFRSPSTPPPLTPKPTLSHSTSTDRKNHPVRGENSCPLRRSVLLAKRDATEGASPTPVR